MKQILLIALVTLGTAISYGQTYTVSGKITQGSDPVVGATITQKNSNNSTTSDLQGNYSLALPSGTQTLVILFTALPVEKTLTVTSDFTYDIDLDTSAQELEAVVVNAARVNADAPITFSELTKEEIQKSNLGQDIPILLNGLPSVVSTTFDGTGIGYSDIRIRGADNSRINVTLNGIPYNDADSQATFWVNLQDFASSVENIQVQRGVGTSTNGAGTFGASINVLTDNYSKDPFAELSNSAGSFNTRKHTVKAGTGLINDHFAFSTRLSRIESDGFVDRAFSDLSSYFIDGIYKDENTLIKALVFGGEEITGLSFAGLDRAGLEADRQFNFDGLFFDSDGNQQFYENQTDNYRQDHYQLHLTQKFDSNWTGNISFHYTYGRGFFEQYIDEASVDFYRLSTVANQGVTNSDLVTRSHLNSDFYGTVFSLNYKDNLLDAIVGGSLNRYDGEQFGEIIFAETAQLPTLPTRFFDNNSDKVDLSVYAKATVNINEQIAVYGDAQIRNISYEAGGSLFNPGSVLDVDRTFTFFNPKAGITYKLSRKNNFYLSYARANREPARVDFENFEPESESLNDFELGWRHTTTKTAINANVFYLDFNNQLVLTGALDQVGFPIRTNSGSSFRAGIEVDATLKITDQFTIKPNIAVSTNKNRDFVAQRDGEFVNLGTTNISFSPDVIAGNSIIYAPTKNVSLTLFSKYVGEQFLANLDLESSKLESYFTNDVNVQYTIHSIPYIKSLILTAQVNNVFNELYENNGFFFSFDVPNDAGNGVTTLDGAGFYPQAGTNFLVGATIRL